MNERCVNQGTIHIKSVVHQDKGTRNLIIKFNQITFVTPCNQIDM